MIPESFLQYLVTFSLGILTAYIELSTYFSQKSKFQIPLFLHFPTVVFLLFNGGLTVLLFYIARTNSWMTINYWELALICGLTAPALLRSKFFTFGQNNEAGFEFIYNFFKSRTVSKLSADSGDKRVEISFDLADRYSSKNNLWQNVSTMITDLSKQNPSWDQIKIEQFKGECDSIVADTTFVDNRSKLAALIRILVDYFGKRAIKNSLQHYLP